MLLGERSVRVDRGKSVVIRIDQHDLDIKTVVATGDQKTVFDNPAGRNGAEWIHLHSVDGAQYTLCFYPVYRQVHTDAYSLSVQRLDTASTQEVEAYRLLSNASAAWATNTLESRKQAIALYDRAALQRSAAAPVTAYARLYAALARAQRYGYEQALAALQELANSRDTFVRYSALWGAGLILNRAGQLDRSRQSLEAALQVARSHVGANGRPPSRDIADLTSLLGEVYLSLGDLRRGEQLVRAALELAPNDDQLLGLIHNNLGYVYLRQADVASDRMRSQQLARSIEAHSQARDFSARAGDRHELSIIQNNLATLFERVGDLRNARRYFETALQLIDDSDDPYRFKTLYRGLGNIYLTLGDYAKSQRFLEGSLAIGDPQSEEQDTRLYCRLGIVHRLQHEGGYAPRTPGKDHLADAVIAHKTCLARAEARADVAVRTEALHELSLDYTAQRKVEEAWSATQAAVMNLPQVLDRDIRSKVMTQHALLLHSRGQKTAARERVREAIDTAVLARYPTTKIDALDAATKIAREQGFTAESRSFAMLAISAIEAVHAHLDAERLGPSWSARTQQIYAQLAADLLRGPGLEDGATRADAFEVVERSRAISLRQHFSAPEVRMRAVRDDPTLAALSELANRTAGDESAAAGMPLAYYHEHDLVSLSRLAGIGDLQVPQPLSVGTIQSTLRADQLALSYFLGEPRAYLFAIGKHSFRVFDLGDSASIAALATTVRNDLQARRDTAASSLRKLSKRLLPSGLGDLPHLTIALDGALHGVPFSALSIENGPLEPEPLARRHSIKLVPSLSAHYMNKRPRSAPHSTELAVFADPLFGGQSAALTQRMPSPFVGWTQRLQRLPWTSKEARRVSTLFPASRTLLYTDAAATRQNLLSDAVLNSRILHIASHGYFESTNPDNVGFALSPTRVGSRIDSGFITLTELFSYRFNNELVVISGCDTALGMDRGGEGMMSLTRGFLAQGASHVVSSLWAVSDRASADFMTLFYQRLVGGAPVAEALAMAQRAMAQQPQYRDPFFWAPYVVTSVAPEDRLAFVANASAR